MAQILFNPIRKGATAETQFLSRSHSRSIAEENTHNQLRAVPVTPKNERRNDEVEEDLIKVGLNVGKPFDNCGVLDLLSLHKWQLRIPIWLTTDSGLPDENHVDIIH